MTLAAALALVLSAVATPATAQSEASPLPAEGGALTAVEWHVVAVGPGPPATEQTVRFEPGGGLAVSTGCASYTSTYDVAGDALTVEALRREFGSIEDCSFGEQGSADTFRDVLENAGVWAIQDEGRLVIRGTGDYETWTLTLEPGDPVSAEVEGEADVDPEQIADSWRLESMDLGPAGSATLPVDIDVILTLSTDGTLTGSGSCSEYQGDFTIVGADAITFSDVSAADPGDCDDQLADLQQLYLGILPVVDGVALEDGSLVLSAAVISAELVYQPAE